MNLRMKYVLAAAVAVGGPLPAVADEGNQFSVITVTGSAMAETWRLPAEAVSRLGLTPAEVPASVEIMTQDQLQLRGLRTSREAFADVVGAVAGNVPGNPAVIGMRGYSGNAVSVLQDGVRVGTSTFVTRDTNTWHYERIEVIKGPASVLQGEGALAGIVNKVTRKPSLDGNRYEGMLGYGGFNTLTTAAGANLQLSDTVAVRLDASNMRADSLYDVAANRTRSSGFSASLLHQPSPRLSLLLAAEHYDDRYDGTYQGMPLIARSAARRASGALRSDDGLVIDRALRRINYNPEGATSGARDTTLRARLDVRLAAGWSLDANLVGYRADRDFVYSGTQQYQAPSPGFPNGSFARDAQRVYHEQDSWSGRLVALHDGHWAGRRNRFSIGTEYSDLDFRNPRQQSPMGAIDAVDPFDPRVGRFPTDDSVYSSGNTVFDTALRTQALFAENAYNLTPDWLLVGGLRYEDIRLDRRVTDLNAGGAQAHAAPGYQPLSWRLGTTYAVNPALTVYAQVTTAVSPVSSLLTLSIANSRFELTKGRAVEAGLRGSWLDERLFASLAAYRIEQRDIITRDPNDPTQAVQGGRLLSRGVEVSLSARPLAAWQLGLGAAYTDAEYDGLVEQAGGVAVDRSGNRPVNIPTTIVQLSSSYRVAAFPMQVSLFARHVSSSYTDTANRYEMRGRTTLDAAVHYRISEQLELTLRGRNLTDAFYAEYSGYPATHVYIGAPRHAELTLNLRF